MKLINCHYTQPSRSFLGLIELVNDACRYNSHTVKPVCGFKRLAFNGAKDCQGGGVAI